MFNRIVDVVVKTPYEILIQDKIVSRATIPQSYENLNPPSICPFSKFADKLKLRTMKKCDGINSLFSKSLLVSSWSDYRIGVDENGTITYNVPDHKHFYVGEHATHEYDAVFKNKVCPKLISPFIIETKNSNFLMTKAIYHQTENCTYKDLMIPQGITPTRAHMNVITLSEKNVEHFIPYKSPLVYLTLMENKQFKIHYEVISKQQFDKIIDDMTTITSFNKIRKANNG